jgi:hypothetical protein
MYWINEEIWMDMNRRPHLGEYADEGEQCHGGGVVRYIERCEDDELVED